MKVIAIIPARFGSTRFPGKPLVDISGKPMIQRVYEQVSKTACISKVLVATDDERIFRAVLEFGGEAVYTDINHQSGTDRCYEAYERSGLTADVIINVQGDEPFIAPEQILSLVELFKRPETQVGTLVKKIENPADLFNPNKVKAVLTKDGKALYFSRHPIPCQKNVSTDQWAENHIYYKHIGMYGFRPVILKQLVSLPVAALEAAEGLEQLRWLENDYEVQVNITDIEAMAIDTPEDLEELLKIKKDIH